MHVASQHVSGAQISIGLAQSILCTSDRSCTFSLSSWTSTRCLRAEAPCSNSAKPLDMAIFVRQHVGTLGFLSGATLRQLRPFSCQIRRTPASEQSRLAKTEKIVARGNGSPISPCLFVRFESGDQQLVSVSVARASCAITHLNRRKFEAKDPIAIFNVRHTL
ncbi:hypothetical protein EJ03DRAFT_147243 [Teratosphaeria nubilosa]|uniref:Uncharacterized protein n=1 Tax=Teratosphaeria nubilosa TaxID=161662 RepID=A0A6G1L4L8_9PEZI|nr:hypothetical protein EJ03DRAFT_147243 [Teratosphaeria nubilosa]